ncbi:MAG: AMP-binding protein, partial [Planctomycetes bacterium]|nr:AMP-binding protein [Planctomycetota bacterium]
MLHESRAFAPSADFQAKARIGSMEEYRRLHKQSIEEPEVFWDGVAKELPWMAPYDQVLDWSGAPVARWFVNGKLNASAVCIDQHVEAGNGDKVAILWEGEPGDRRTFTYREMLAEVSRFANVLKARGFKKGDRLAIYMPMIPELAMAVLACARIGAIHSVVFGGFSAQALCDRIQDGGCTGVITADGAWRRGQVLPLKAEVDAALELCGADHGVHTVLTVKRTENEVQWDAERDAWYHELAAHASDVCAPEPMDAEDVLFLLYTSGSTGKPKGIMHTTGGYMVGAYLSSRYVFDLRDEDVYWCTADVGWITGH